MKEVQSKWGPYFGYYHAPEDVHPKWRPQGDTIQYYFTIRGGECKEQHTLKEAKPAAKCGCIGLEPWLLFLIIRLFKRRKERL